MKSIILLILSSWSLFTFAHEDWNLKELSVEKTLGEPFQAREGKDFYLSFDLKYAAIKPLFEKVDKYSYRKLKTRGEAHITVITPPEFQDDLSKFVSDKEINQIAEKLNIQKASYKPICLAKGSMDKDDKYFATYFMVVESQDLLNIRKEIAKLYQSRGGKKFDPLHFYPHITLGFTERDLYESDGVIKDAKTCMKTLHISPLPSKVMGLAIANSSYVDKNNKGGAIIRGSAPLNHQNLDLLKNFGISEFVIFKNDKAGEVKDEIGGLTDSGIERKSVTHINFDWKDNEDFSSGCKKIIQGIDLMKSTLQKNKKIYFHCTTGEDRTGVLAVSYLLAEKKSSNIQKLFKTEMCDKGYEAGDPDKDLEVVDKIRAGLTKTFLKTAYRIEEAKKQKHAINEEICAKDPASEEGFLKYSTQGVFTCGKAAAKK